MFIVAFVADMEYKGDLLSPTSPAGNKSTVTMPMNSSLWGISKKQQNILPLNVKNYIITNYVTFWSRSVCCTERFYCTPMYCAEISILVYIILYGKGYSSGCALQG